VWVIVGVAAVPSVTLWTRAGRRIGNARALSLACLAEALGVSLTVLWANAAGVVLGALLLGGTMMGITALGLVHARELSAGDPRRTLALVTAAFGLGQTVGPTFAGVLVDHTGGFTAPTLIAAAALVLAAALATRAETKARD
jgi:predicted MFS family arabinose efflux permease